MFTTNYNTVIQNLMMKAQRYHFQAGRLVGGLAVRHYRDSFRNQGFTDQVLQRWLPKKALGTILVDTGQLRGSINFQLVSNDYVRIYSNVPYAAYHNYGTQHIPQRQFIGRSQQLNNTMNDQLTKLAKRSLA